MEVNGEPADNAGLDCDKLRQDKVQSTLELTCVRGCKLEWNKKFIVLSCLHFVCANGYCYPFCKALCKAGYFKCPVCMIKLKEEELEARLVPQDIFIGNYVCEYCVQNTPAILYCTVCCVRLCECCVKWRSKIKRIQDHRLIQLSEVDLKHDRLKKASKKCDEHEQTFTHFCQECHVRHCEQCQSFHTNHPSYSVKAERERLLSNVELAKTIHEKSCKVVEAIERMLNILSNSELNSLHTQFSRAAMQVLKPVFGEQLEIEHTPQQVQLKSKVQPEIDVLNSNIVEIEIFKSFCSRFTCVAEFVISNGEDIAPTKFMSSCKVVIDRLTQISNALDKDYDRLTGKNLRFKLCIPPLQEMLNGFNEPNISAIVTPDVDMDASDMEEIPLNLSSTSHSSFSSENNIGNTENYLEQQLGLETEGNSEEHLPTENAVVNDDKETICSNQDTTVLDNAQVQTTRATRTDKMRQRLRLRLLSKLGGNSSKTTATRVAKRVSDSDLQKLNKSRKHRVNGYIDNTTTTQDTNDEANRDMNLEADIDADEQGVDNEITENANEMVSRIASTSFTGDANDSLLGIGDGTVVDDLNSRVSGDMDNEVNMDKDDEVNGVEVNEVNGIGDNEANGVDVNEVDRNSEQRDDRSTTESGPIRKKRRSQESCVHDLESTFLPTPGPSTSVPKPVIILNNYGYDHIIEDTNATHFEPSPSQEDFELHYPIQGKINLKAGNKNAGDKNDDYCYICFDGGDLICCDYCVKVFHSGCHAPTIPEKQDEKWKCSYCFKKGDFAAYLDGSENLPLTNSNPKHHLLACKFAMEFYSIRESPVIRWQFPKAYLYRYHEVPVHLKYIRDRLTISDPSPYQGVEELLSDFQNMFRHAIKYYEKELPAHIKVVFACFEKFTDLVKRFYPKYNHTLDDLRQFVHDFKFVENQPCTNCKMTTNCSSSMQ